MYALVRPRSALGRSLREPGATVNGDGTRQNDRTHGMERAHRAAGGTLVARHRHPRAIVCLVGLVLHRVRLARLPPSRHENLCRFRFDVYVVLHFHVVVF
jgi:hypothetical protein